MSHTSQSARPGISPPRDQQIRIQMHKIDEKLANVTARLQGAAQNSGRNAEQITLIAVSKTRPADDLRAAHRAGQRHFGENYLQEALAKQAALSDLTDIQWHFLGPIQSNKTRDIASHFSWLHSLDRLKIARRLNAQRPAHLAPLQVCLQVNIDAEASKSGVSLAELPALAKAVDELAHLRLRGLMAIPAKTDSSERQRASFAALRQALEALRELKLRGPLDTLSMGMSADLEAGVGEGATMVRVGTDIFGPRATVNRN